MVPPECKDFDRQKITETLLNYLIVPFLFENCYPATLMAGFLLYVHVGFKN